MKTKKPSEAALVLATEFLSVLSEIAPANQPATLATLMEFYADRQKSQLEALLSAVCAIQNRTNAKKERG